MMKSGAPPDKFGVLYRMATYIEFHGFTSRINSKGYHSLVPGLNLFRDGMGPFKGNKSNWLSPLKQVLTEHGFKEVWDNRGTLREHKFLIDLKST